jgi:flavin reductase (DIM6/NTAB) family NADH-FMN oxidoreductase RutF
MEINPQKNPKVDNYKLLIGGILPRPIAWITSMNTSGIINAAPFSFFTVVATDPPLLGVAVMRKPNGDTKDTAKNILESGEYVINVVDETNLESMNHTSCDYPPEISEIEQAGLNLTSSKVVGVPRIVEAKVHYECRLYQHLALGNGPNCDFIIGEVIHIHVNDEVYKNGKIDTEALAPVGRLAGSDYSTVGKVISIPRPVYKK